MVFSAVWASSNDIRARWTNKKRTIEQKASMVSEFVEKRTATFRPSSVEKALALAYGLALLATLIRGYLSLADVPIHSDESNWIQSAYYYTLLKEGDLSHQDWSHFVFYDHPPIAKYILGFALDVTNNKIAKSIGGLMAWHEFALNAWCQEPLNALQADSQLLDDPVLVRRCDFCNSLKSKIHLSDFEEPGYREYVAGRTTVWLFAILLTILVVAACWLATKHVSSGLIAGCVFLNNEVTGQVFQQVLADSIAWFFSLAALGLLMLLIREMNRGIQRPARVLGFSVLLGAMLALAMGTKFVTASAPVTVLITLIADICIRTKSAIRRHTLRQDLLPRLFTLLVVVVSSMIVFVCTNPFLLMDPIRNTVEMIHYRTAITDLQSEYEVMAAVKSFPHRVLLLYEYGLFLGFDYRSYPIPCLLFFATVFLGCAVATRRSLEELATGAIGVYAIFGIWAINTAILNGLMFHMVQFRYFVPFAIIVSFLFAIGADDIVDRIFARSPQRIPEPKAI